MKNEELITEKPVEPGFKRSQNYRTHANFVLGERPGDMEANSGKSLTTPGMADSLRTIIDRFVSGRDIPISQDPYFLGDMPDPNDMDKTEREMYKRHVHQTIKEKREEIANLQAQSTQMRIDDQQARIKELEEKNKHFPDPPTA
ncbi:hypothetical protein [Eel River basin pequenovirus]|nr:hypothetical protein [Eel River basin pequenovirus]